MSTFPGFPSEEDTTGPPMPICRGRLRTASLHDERPGLGAPGEIAHHDGEVTSLGSGHIYRPDGSSRTV